MSNRNDTERVTFTLPSGARVTCSREQAERLGHKPTPASKPADKKPTSRRRTTTTK